jgi:uncharacterized protein (DUF1778 family)
MSTATAQIHLRTPPRTKSLLQRAAEFTGAENLTDYVLRAAVERARQDLMSQRVFAMNKAQWQEFNKRLDLKPRELSRLRTLLASPDVFDRAAKQA